MICRVVILVDVPAPSRLAAISRDIEAFVGNYDLVKPHRFFLGVRDPLPRMSLNMGTLEVIVEDAIAEVMLEAFVTRKDYLAHQIVRADGTVSGDEKPVLATS